MSSYRLDFVERRCVLPSSSSSSSSAPACLAARKRPSSSWVLFQSFGGCSSGSKDALWDGMEFCALRLQHSAVGLVRALPQVQQEPNLSCDYCTGRGWLVCDFCNGQKTNVQVKNNRFYRRCPSCRAVGVTLCSYCKVFKCITFPDEKDGSLKANSS